VNGRFDRRIELAATVRLAVAAVATAGASYQAARWRGEQARAASGSIAARVESTREANVANRRAQIDVVLFAVSLFFAGISTRGARPRRGRSSSASARSCSSAP
jgi:hypothetical protein